MKYAVHQFQKDNGLPVSKYNHQEVLGENGVQGVRIKILILMDFGLCFSTYTFYIYLDMPEEKGGRSNENKRSSSPKGNISFEPGNISCSAMHPHLIRFKNRDILSSMVWWTHNEGHKDVAILVFNEKRRQNGANRLK